MVSESIGECVCVFFFFQAEDGIRDLVRSRGLGDVYKRQAEGFGEHPTLLMTDITGRSADEAGKRVTLAVLAAIHADQGFGTPAEGGRKLQGRLGLACVVVEWVAGVRLPDGLPWSTWSSTEVPWRFGNARSSLLCAQVDGGIRRRYGQ